MSSKFPTLLVVVLVLLAGCSDAGFLGPNVMTEKSPKSRKSSIRC
ncbi:hypothetical protein ACFFQF_11555 [Haladaptatus pallidirubidus]|nr:hypothetical protein [Haladaptatus pallidirubidus]